jgi:hypothetical protein
VSETNGNGNGHAKRFLNGTWWNVTQFGLAAVVAFLLWKVFIAYDAFAGNGINRIESAIREGFQELRTDNRERDTRMYERMWDSQKRINDQMEKIEQKIKVLSDKPLSQES